MLLTSKFIIFKIKNYDNSENSFKEINTWLNEIKNNSSPDIKKFLIGNKADLEESRKITKEEALKMKEDFGFNLFMETSAKTGFNAEELFIQACKTLYNKNLECQKITVDENLDDKEIILLDTQGKKDNEEKRINTKKKCCC